jgi:hypothetical protein
MGVFCGEGILVFWFLVWRRKAARGSRSFTLLTGHVLVSRGGGSREFIPGGRSAFPIF